MNAFWHGLAYVAWMRDVWAQHGLYGHTYEITRYMRGYHLGGMQAPLNWRMVRARQAVGNILPILPGKGTP